MQASSNGHESVMKYLLEIGADVNRRAITGETALSAACMYNKKRIVELLLMYGACPLYNHQQAIHKSIQRSADCVTTLIELAIDLNMSGVFLLQAACIQPCYKAVTELLEQGAEHHNNNGMLIMNACRGGDPIIVQILLERCEAEIDNLRDELGRTSLIVAASYRDSVEMARYLIECGVDIEARDRQGLNALKVAEYHGCKGISEYLRKLKKSHSSSLTSLVIKWLNTLLPVKIMLGSTFLLARRSLSL